MGKVYTISFKEPGQESYNLIYGPNPSLRDCLDFWPTDFQHQAFILEFNDSNPSVYQLVFKFNSRRNEWEPIERSKDFSDPMFGSKYEVVLRSREELITLLGENKLKSMEFFFGKKADIDDPNNHSQYACVYHQGKLVRIYTDRIRLEDDAETLRRDLEWVRFAAEAAYAYGWFDGLAARLSKPSAALKKTAVKQPSSQIELPLGGGTNKTIKRIK